MKNKKILIVDDEIDIVVTIKFCLEAEGFECLEAYDGEEALNIARKEKPGLIILDVMIPRMNGYKVARMLKFDEDYKDIPIIMLTARTQDKDVKLGEETGADMYIKKPFDMDSLIAAAKGFIGGA